MRALLLLKGIMLISAFAFVASGATPTDPGITKDAVTFGLVTSLSGSVGNTGQLILDGYKAGFDRVNATGGVFGRKLMTRTKDDSYDPASTVDLTSKMIRKHRVFALIGYNGTSTTKAAFPYILDVGVPFLFPRTGEQSVRRFNKNVFHFRPSFSEEVDALIRYAGSKGLNKVAILFQTDAFGDSLRRAAIVSIERLKKEERSKIQIVSVSGIDRNSTEPKFIQVAFDRIDKGNPDAVLLATSLPISGPFVKFARDQKKPWTFFAVSSTNNLADKLVDTDAEVIFSQVVPNPFDSTGVELISQYKDDMKKAGFSKNIGFSSLESYFTARIITEALQRSGPHPTRAKFIQSLEEKPFLISGLKVEWSAKNHNGSSQVYLTRFRKNTFETLQSSSTK